MSKKKIKIKELFIDDNSGVDFISLVKDPAIEVDYMKFSKQVPVKFSITNSDEQIITGPAMIPDKLIYRFDEENSEEFYVYFSTDTIKQISQKFMIDKKQENVNVEHTYNIDNVVLVESWLIEDQENDKAKALGYDLPKGTWMCSMKVTDNELWKSLKESDLAGFSVEGMFIQAFSGQPKIESIEDNIFSFDENVDAQYAIEIIKDMLVAEGFAEAPKKTYKKWVTNKSDTGPCEFCSGLDGKEVPYGEKWSHQGYDNLVPGKVHKGCKCTWEKVKK